MKRYLTIPLFITAATLLSCGSGELENQPAKTPDKKSHITDKDRQLLKDLRNNNIDFVFEHAIDESGNTFDKNSAKRGVLLAALRNDLRGSDEAIVVEFFKQEIEERKAGVSDTLESIYLCAYLLSKFKNPGNVWLFVEAKTIDFDISSMMDGAFLVSAGIPETYNYVDGSNHKLKSKFYTIAGSSIQNCFFDEEDLVTLDQFWQGYFKP